MDTDERPQKRPPKYRRKFAFRYADYARLFGMKEDATKKAAQRGSFDPSSLASVIAFYELKKGSGALKARAEELERLLARVSETHEVMAKEIRRALGQEQCSEAR